MNEVGNRDVGPGVRLEQRHFLRNFMVFAHNKTSWCLKTVCRSIRDGPGASCHSLGG